MQREQDSVPPSSHSHFQDDYGRPASLEHKPLASLSEREAKLRELIAKLKTLSDERHEYVPAKDFIAELWASDTNLALRYKGELSPLIQDVSELSHRCVAEAEPYSLITFTIKVVTEDGRARTVVDNFQTTSGAPLSAADNTCLVDALASRKSTNSARADFPANIPPFIVTLPVKVGTEPRESR